MKNRGVILLVIFLIVVLGGIVFVTFFNEDANSENLVDVLKINTTYEMSEVQKGLYLDIIDKYNEDPTDYRNLFELATLKQALLDNDGAIELYDELKKQKPKDLLILNNLANLYYNLKDYEKSEEINLGILEISPKWINAYNELLDIYRYHLKDKAGSFEKVLLDGIANYPEMESGLVVKAAVYYDEVMNNEAKAIEYYQKALTYSPDDSSLKIRLDELKNN
jgi:tetratricopeptide (TPR) repeat protein